MRALLVLVLLAGCAAPPPVAVPGPGPGPGIATMGGVACLAPMQPGEPDPALRDVRMIRLSPTVVSFKGCLASDRAEGWGDVAVLISVLGAEMQQDCVVPGEEGLNGCRGGDSVALMVRLVPPVPGGPRVLGLLSRESHLAPPRPGFPATLFPMALARIKATPCRNGDCTSQLVQVNYQMVPISP